MDPIRILIPFVPPRRRGHVVIAPEALARSSTVLNDRIHQKEIPDAEMVQPGANLELRSATTNDCEDFRVQVVLVNTFPQG